MNVLNAYREMESHHFDLKVDHCGSEVCDKDYAFGPAIRDNYVLHFIINGKGRFTIDGVTHHLAKGDLFLLPKDKLTFYQADHHEPWSYIWVGFSGSRVEEILRQSLLDRQAFLHSHLQSAILDNMLTITKLSRLKLTTATELLLIGELHQLLANLLEEFPAKESSEPQKLAKIYVHQAIKMIHSQYNTPLKVSEIADKLAISRSYLYKIFKQETGYSIKDYMLSIKMNRSCQLLLHPNLSIAEVAYSIGYQDPLNFSRTFKNFFHMTPTDYRKSQLDKINP